MLPAVIASVGKKKNREDLDQPLSVDILLFTGSIAAVWRKCGIDFLCSQLL